MVPKVCHSFRGFKEKLPKFQGSDPAQRAEGHGKELFVGGEGTYYHLLPEPSILSPRIHHQLVKVSPPTPGWGWGGP